MKKATILVIVILIVIINYSFGYCGDVFQQQVNNLTEDLVRTTIKEKTGYLIKTEDEKAYFNLGFKDGVRKGDKFKVVRTEDLLVDPTTGIRLGEITRDLAQIEVIRVEEEFSVAEITEFYSSLSLRKIDKVKQVNKNVAIVEFASSENISGLASLTRQYIINYLTGKEIELENTQRLDKVTEKLNVEPPFSLSDLSLIGDDLKTDLLIAGEIYEGKDKLFIKSSLFEVRTGSILKETVKTISLNNDLIQYYKVKNSAGAFPYQKLLINKLFDFPGLAVEVAEVDEDQEQEIVLVMKDELKILTYQDGELKSDWKINNYNRTEYDDYKAAAGRVSQLQSPEIFVENFNHLFRFTWEGGKYVKRKVPGFVRNRPKGIKTLKGKKYLVTRDYLHYLKFNLNQDGEYITDFKLQLKKNEGYRIEIADIDKDQEEELIVTAYQEKNNYKIKIYTLNGELEKVLSGVYGPEIAVIDNKLAVQNINEDNQQIVFYNYFEGKYKRIWVSEDFDLPIKDFTGGDINNDGIEELVVLVGNETQSRLYVYAEGKREEVSNKNDNK